MTGTGTNGPEAEPLVDLEGLGLDRGGHLLLVRALAGPGTTVRVRGRAPGLAGQVRAWARGEGHEVLGDAPGSEGSAVGESVRLRAGPTVGARLRGATRAGGPGAGETVDHPLAAWGVAARGALVEPGAPALDFRLAEKDVVWADEAPRLYAEGAAAQWDPAKVAWATPFELPPAVEAAVVQVMTYLVENELAALAVPARFLGQIHPHFREVVQLLALQAADEARHVEVFARRASLRGADLGLATAGGLASLETLFREPDFAVASFLLSVLGEGSFLALLSFLDAHAPDPVTREIVRLSGRDEARHVAFGVAHLRRHVGRDPTLRARLAAAVDRRHGALAQTAGLNALVFDALVLLAAGSWEPTAIARGWDAVQRLQADMDEGRRRRLEMLGFTSGESATLSSLHTRNFM